MKYILLALCAIELLFITYCQNIAGPYLSPLLFLLTSVGIGIVYLQVTLAAPNQARATRAINPKIILALQLFVFCALSYLVIKTLKTIWWWDVTQHSAIAQSDIIDIITTLVRRFLGHEQPYTVIHFKTYDIPPTYLPFQWAPYILTELAHKDYRWVPAISLWLSSLYFFIKNCALRKEKMPLMLSILLPVWPLIVWYTIIMHYNPMFQFTVEGLIAAYYLFVATAIGSRHIAVLAAGMALCLLSRYSIVLWVPLCLGAFFIAGKRKEALIITGILFLCFLAFYWYPFLRKDPSIFIRGYHYYADSALKEWQRDMLLGQHKFYLTNGLGFTSWALKLLPGGLVYICHFYQNILLIFCLLSVALMFVFYWFNKTRIPLHVFLLMSFKIYLAIFYSFIIVPYNYLYLVPVITSSALLANAFKTRKFQC